MPTLPGSLGLSLVCCISLQLPTSKSHPRVRHLLGLCSPAAVASQQKVPLTGSANLDQNWGAGALCAQVTLTHRPVCAWKGCTACQIILFLLLRVPESISANLVWLGTLQIRRDFFSTFHPHLPSLSSASCLSFCGPSVPSWDSHTSAKTDSWMLCPCPSAWLWSLTPSLTTSKSQHIKNAWRQTAQEKLRAWKIEVQYVLIWFG